MKKTNTCKSLFYILLSLLMSDVTLLKGQSELIGYTYLGIRGTNSYYISNCEATWEEANEAAVEMGGYLATIHSNNESHFLGFKLEVLKYNEVFEDDELSGAWIGLRGEQGTYEWANGELVTFTYWDYPSEPVYPDGAALLGLNQPLDSEHSWITNPVSSEAEFIVEFSSDPHCSNPDKSYVCHNGNTICVNISAVQSHLNHGDLAGPCGPCNGYAMQAFPDETYAAEGQAPETANGDFSKSNEENNRGQLMTGSYQINFSPNPVATEIQIALPTFSQKGRLSILTMTGQEIMRVAFHDQNSITLDVSEYVAGIYLIDIQSTNGHYQRKFVKL